MTIKQLSVFLENRRCSLLEPLQTLAGAGLNLSGLSLADTEQFGILRLVMKDWEQGRDLLQRQGWVVKDNDMVGVAVDDQPGGLVQTLEVLAAADADIEYMYAFHLRHNGRAVLLFRVDDPAAAVAALAGAGISTVSEQHLY
jgi:hypothetical protein